MTHGKSKKKLPESSGGKESRESKRAHKSEPSMLTTVSLLLTSTPTSNLSANLSQSITSNRTFCSTVRTLQSDDLSTAPTFEVKMFAKTKKLAYSVNFKSKKKLLESSREKGSRESKGARKSETSTPTTVSLSLKSTPTLNLSATSSQSITWNETFCSTVRTLHLDDLSTTPATAKSKKPACFVNFCNSAETLAECLKYVTNPKSVPKDQELKLTFLLDQYKPNDLCIAFCQLIGKVRGSATTAFQPLPHQKNQLIKNFLALIYDTKSMLVDISKDTFK